MSNNLVPFVEKNETTDQKRRRLATELNLIVQQFNSKVFEILDEGVDVDILFRDGSVIGGTNSLITTVDCSYQTKRKHYGR